MERTEIIKAIDILERFDFFQGQRAGRELWNKKPVEVQEEDLEKFSRDVTWFIDFIKELTEENKELEKENDDLVSEKVIYIQQKVTLKDENERLKAHKSYWKKRAESAELEHDKAVKNGYDYGKADTVRKFAERLKAICWGEIICPSTIDRIAKEILEDEEK